MDVFFTQLAAYSILIPILIVLVLIVILYWVIRLAIGRGLRDHQLWMEQRQPPTPPAERKSLVPPPSY